MCNIRKFKEGVFFFKKTLKQSMRYYQPIDWKRNKSAYNSENPVLWEITKRELINDIPFAKFL